MSDYVQANNFSSKDDLPAGSGGDKLILGAEWDEEFDAIETAVATKYDSSDLADQSEAEAGTASNVIMTPLRLTQFFSAKDDDRGLSYDTENWTREAVTSQQSFSSATFTSFATGLSLPAAGVYEFEFIGWCSRDSNVLLSFRPGGFSTAPTAIVIGCDGLPTSAFNVFGDEETGGELDTGIRLGSISSEVMFRAYGLIRVGITTTFALQGRRQFSSGSSGACNLEAGSYFKYRRLVDNS